jgi:hypothetical protein
MPIPRRFAKDPVAVAKMVFAGAALAHMVYYYATVNRPGVARWEIAAGVVAAFGSLFLAEGTVPFFRNVRAAQGGYQGVIAALFNFFAAFAALAAAMGHTLGALTPGLSRACEVAFVIGLGGLAVFATAYFIGGGYEDARLGLKRETGAAPGGAPDSKPDAPNVTQNRTPPEV